MEAESIRMQNDYRSLQLSLASLAGAGGEELSAQFRQDLVSEVEVLSAGVPEAEIAAVLGDPSLTDEEKGARVVELISTNLQALDREIERQAQLVQTQRDSLSLDVETMKLKRMIDKRSQTFDALRQIIDRYNQTAKGIIDSIGR
jgi:DNA-binding transcriptional MerR regulator